MMGRKILKHYFGFQMAKKLEELETEVAAAGKGREETAERQELKERLRRRRTRETRCWSG